MNIHITAQGDPDAVPLCCMFERKGCADEVFVTSVKNVSALLEQKRRINIHQALLLFAARTAESLDGGADEEQARLDITDFLSQEQVMIGVPEMTQQLVIEVKTRHKTTVLEVHDPIN